MQKRKGQSASTVTLAIVGVVALGVAFSSIASVSVGEKAVLTNFNKVSNTVLSSGYSLKAPWTGVHNMSIRKINSTGHQLQNVYNIDQQNVTVDFNVIYHLPNSDKDLIDIYKNYSGDPFNSFALPRIWEAIKIVTGKYAIDGMTHEASKFKSDVMIEAQKRIGTIVNIDDINITNITFDKEIEDAIRNKQVAVQNAEAAKNKLVQTKIEAEQAVAKAEGEAKALKVKADAIAKSQSVVRLEEIKKWDGHIPLNAKIIGSGVILKDTSDSN